MTLRKHARQRHSRSLRFKTLDGCLLLAADAFDVLEPLSSTEYHFVYQRAARERVDRLTASRRRLRGSFNGKPQATAWPASANDRHGLRIVAGGIQFEHEVACGLPLNDNGGRRRSPAACR